jgi:hypothetical protein
LAHGAKLDALAVRGAAYAAGGYNNLAADDFRAALKLDPGNQKIAGWLAQIDSSVQQTGTGYTDGAVTPSDGNQNTCQKVDLGEYMAKGYTTHC